jgi:restriction system protein
MIVTSPGIELVASALLFNRRRASDLPTKTRVSPTTALALMSWRDFERLVSEAFRQRGFTVTGFGGNGPDGGVDLGLMKNGERFLVQCKHWRKQQVGVTVVRELNGVIAALGANGGYVVTGGQFTREAQEFAQKTKIQLFDGSALEQWIGHVGSIRSRHLQRQNQG